MPRRDWDKYHLRLQVAFGVFVAVIIVLALIGRALR